MRQCWNHLFFLHWTVDVESLARRIPAHLKLDLYRGEAYVGVVGMHMSHIWPSKLPGNCNFFQLDELHLRTYVRGPDGVPGVYFFTLESNGFFANWVARAIYRLPYRYARLRYHCDEEGGMMRGWKPENIRFDYSFKRKGRLRLAKGDPLENFLLERYCYYSESKGLLYRGGVEHTPYVVEDIEVDEWSGDIFGSQGLEVPREGPVHACYAGRQEIRTTGCEGILSNYRIEEVVFKKAGGV